VLIDPAYEDAGDFARLPATLAAARRKWASGTYLVGTRSRTDRPDVLARRLRSSESQEILRAELSITRASRVGSPRAASSRSNPPWTLAGELAILLPELATVLSARPAALIASTGSPAKGSFATFPQRWISLFFVGLALTFRLLWGPAE